MLRIFERRMARLAAMAAVFALVGCGAERAGEPNAVAGQSQPQQPGNATGEDAAASNAVEPAGTSACLVQDGAEIAPMNLHAIGTEPFWGADVKGRCVTYSTPDNQAGMRVWTQFSGSAESGTWTGALEGKPFIMRTRPQPRCSDGMSDNRFPIAVTLTVNGEERRGCAEPRP